MQSSARCSKAHPNLFANLMRGSVKMERHGGDVLPVGLENTLNRPETCRRSVQVERLPPLNLEWMFLRRDGPGAGCLYIRLITLIPKVTAPMRSPVAGSTMICDACVW